MFPGKSSEGPTQPDEGRPQKESDNQNALPAKKMGGEMMPFTEEEQRLVVRGQHSMGLNEDTASQRLVEHVPLLRDFWKNVGTKRLGELYWLRNKEGHEPVDDIAEQFRRVVFILMGRRLGGFTGQRVTPEGMGRIELLVQFLKLGVLNPEEFNKAILVFSGHRGEAQAFYAHFLVNVMNSESLQWTGFRDNMHMETDAEFSNENIIFSHDDVLEKFKLEDVKDEKPILWIVCSTDFHIQSLLIAHAACKGGPGSPLASLLHDENRGDRVAFLSAPNPYRHSTDPGVRASQRIMESTFYFGQAVLNNLGSLLDHLDPGFTLRTVKEEEKRKDIPLTEKIPPSRLKKLKRSQQHPDRYAKRVYGEAVDLFKLLPTALKYIHDKLFPERDGKLWKGTIAGPRLTEIDSAYAELDLPSWERGSEHGRYLGTIGRIVNELEEAVAAGEGVTFPEIDTIFTEIRKKIIENIRHWGDPENTLKQPKQ